MIRVIKYLSLLAIVAAIAGGFALYQLRNWYDTSISLESNKIFKFEKGLASNALANQLEEQGVITDAILYRLSTRIFSDYRKFQAGLYQFEGSVTPKGITDKFVRGDTYNVVALDFTIPEGFTLKQIAARLAAKGVGSQTDVLLLAKDKELIKNLGVPSSSLEGYLYPATYTFYNEKPTIRATLTRMVKEFFKRLPSDYIRRARLKGITLEEAVIFASLIELETLHDDERTLVSEVIWARINKGAPLGIDAAIIYGIDDYDGDLKWVHLKDKKNPYNTRIHKGLPPTPIGSPSLASLNAVLEPANNNYYYYVLKPGKSQRHHFSRSLKEHNRHVKLLIKAQKTK